MSRIATKYQDEICEECGRQAVDKFRGEYICEKCLCSDLELTEQEKEDIIYKRRAELYPETHNWGEPTEVKKAYEKLRKKVPIKDWNFYADIER